MSRASTRTLLLGIFVIARRPLTAPQLIALARPLGITSTNVKSHLTRMVAEGALARSGPPRSATYGPSSARARFVDAIAARFEEPPRERWDGRWLVLSLHLPASRRVRERVRGSLWFDGFRPWTAGTFVRPAWPRREILARARSYLERFSGFALRGELVGTLDDTTVATLYGLEALDREAKRLARYVDERRRLSRSRWRSVPEAAFAARLEVGGRVASFLGHDPGLPDSIWGRRQGMRELRQKFRRFENRIAPLAQRFIDSIENGNAPGKGGASRAPSSTAQ